MYAWINGLSGVAQFVLLPRISVQPQQQRWLQSGWIVFPMIMLGISVAYSYCSNNTTILIATGFVILKTTEYSLRSVLTELVRSRVCCCCCCCCCTREALCVSYPNHEKHLPVHIDLRLVGSRKSLCRETDDCTRGQSFGEIGRGLVACCRSAGGRGQPYCRVVAMVLDDGLCVVVARIDPTVAVLTTTTNIDNIDSIGQRQRCVTNAKVERERC